LRLETGELLLIVKGVREAYDGYALRQGKDSRMITTRYNDSATSYQANDVLGTFDLSIETLILSTQ